MKCRGCGNDTRDIEIVGVGWMHYECEIKRLTGLLEEASEAHEDALDAAVWLFETAKDVIAEDFVRDAVESWPWLVEVNK